MIEAVCLTLTGLCTLTGLALFALCARRDDGFLGLAGLTALIIAALPATVYGGLAS